MIMDFCDVCQYERSLCQCKKNSCSSPMKTYIELEAENEAQAARIKRLVGVLEEIEKDEAQLLADSGTLRHFKCECCKSKIKIAKRALKEVE